MTRRLLLILVALLPPAVLSIADGDIVGPPPRITKLTADTDAQTAAWEDLQRIGVVDRLFTRYLWIPSELWEDFQATAYAYNLVSRSSTAYPLAEGQIVGGYLLRIDLRELAPRSDDGVNDLAEVLQTWEELRFSPEFNKLLTANAVRNLIADAVFTREQLGVIEVGKEKILVKCRPYKFDGETFKERWVSVVRLVPEHQDAKLVANLEQATGSEAPIVHYKYFITRALTAIKGKGVFKDLWGGLYYDFSGIKTAKQAGKKGVTDEDVLFDGIGIGANAEKVFDGLRSDQRIASLHSGVTGQKRRVDFLPAKSVAPNVAQSVAVVTHDVSTQDVDLDQDPFANLLKFEDTAREMFFTKKNGLQAGVLFDGKGALQEVAPQNVVSDSTIPHPYAQDLQPYISCLRCHFMDGSDGWKPLTNDVPALVQYGLSVIDDRSRRGKSQADTIDRLNGLYAGTPEKEKAVQKVLRRAREDTLEAILSVTGRWKEDKDRTEIGRLSAEAIGRLYADYNYKRIDAGRALEEMGYQVTGRAREAFRDMVKPDPSLLEDYRIGVLKADRTLGRVEWSLVHGFATERARRSERKAKP